MKSCREMIVVCFLFFSCFFLLQGRCAEIRSSVAVIPQAMYGYSGVRGADGTLYVAYSDNHTIKLAVSEDNGATWQTQTPNTSHNGVLRYPTIAVDGNGKVFIFCRYHASYPSDPSVYALGQQDVYCITNVSDAWAEELVINNATYNGGYGSSNNTALPFGVFADSDNNIHLFLFHYYWYSYGGKTYEKIRTAGAEGTWGALITAIHIYDANVDNDTGASENVIQTSDGGAAIIAWNMPANNCYYVTRPKNGAWSSPTILSSIESRPDYADVNLGVDFQDNIHALFMGPSHQALKLSKNWGEPELAVALPGTNRCPYSFVDVDLEGKVTVGYRVYDFDTKAWVQNKTQMRVEKEPGGSWGTPVSFQEMLGIEELYLFAQQVLTYDMGPRPSPYQWLYYAYNDSGAAYPLSLEYWQEDSGQPVEVLKADLNNDKYVDSLDLMILMKEWHQGTPPLPQ